MASKAIDFAQAIIDQEFSKCEGILRKGNVDDWINDRVPKYELQNHRLSDKFEWTTVMSVCSRTSPFSMLKELTTTSASLYNINSNGHSALTWTCLHKRDTLEKVKCLLEKDETLLHSTNNQGFSSLHLASQKGQVEVVKYILEKGADANHQTINGTSSLHLAASSNNPAVIAVLFRYGADLHIRSKHNNTPLHSAALEGSTDALRTLISFGCDVHNPGQ